MSGSFVARSRSGTDRACRLAYPCPAARLNGGLHGRPRPGRDRVEAYRRGATPELPAAEVLELEALEPLEPRHRLVGSEEPVSEIPRRLLEGLEGFELEEDRKSTRLNSSHLGISYAVFCLKKKNTQITSNVLTLTDPDLAGERIEDRCLPDAPHKSAAARPAQAPPRPHYGCEYSPTRPANP